MTSKSNNKHCFVYITLPNEIKAVTAARYELKNGVGRLVYGRSYLKRQDAVEIDPVELKLVNRIYQTVLLNGVFGALRDASPDYWGRLVISRALGRSDLDELEYLLYAANDCPGALGFGHNEQPPAPNRDFNKTIELKKLQEVALAILEDAEISGPEARQIARLLLRGTSMGGARPKAVVEDSKGLWIAKFNKPEDKWSNARVEHAMLRLAQKCGIKTAESKTTRVAGRDVVLVQRFDRKKVEEGYHRSRMVSALTLLRAEDTIESRSRGEWSYPALAEELRRTCSNPKGVANELFQRMCFNALISNTDDHPRNHAIIAWDHGWQLSPAYDLTPTPAANMERHLAMIVGDFAYKATAGNLLSQAGRFLLRSEEAQAIVQQMRQIVAAEWYPTARAAGVTMRDCEMIRRAFENEGFFFLPESA